MSLNTYLTDTDAASVGAPQVNAVLAISTAGRAEVVDRENYVSVAWSLSGGGFASAHGTGRVKGRGHGSWTFLKKPYTFKLDVTQPLLGMPASKDWVLLANAADLAGARTSLAFTLAAMATGMPYSPRANFVDLFFNNEYRGQYQLTEKAQFAATRINASKASGTSGLTSTGAYLMEISRYDDPPAARFVTTQGVGINFDDPDGTDATQEAYMQGFVQTFEDALYGSSFADPTNGFRKYVDINSFIDWYLVNELMANPEGAFGSSCRFYKTRDTGTPGVLFMGPVWDFDLSFQPSGLSSPVVRPGAKWLDRMFQDSTFVTAAAARWTALKAAITAAGGSNTVVSAAIARPASGQIRDSTRWNYTADYAAALAEFKATFAGRQAYVDSLFA